jgi:ABC-2 type transport system ATP-binding protein
MIKVLFGLCYNFPMSEVIVVSDLKKSYPLPRKARQNGERTFEAVKGTSFSVKEGEIFGILGPNGAGKTTTLEIIEGLKEQTSGTITVLGLDNLKDRAKVQKRIGVQLQSSEYMHHMTLAELLHLFASLYGCTADIEELLGFVNLEGKQQSMVKNLSGGQKQRFTLASALVNNPEILFLDEPTTGLDPRARRDVWDLIRKINSRGITIVMTTHYMEEAEYLCSRVAIMDSGRVLAINDPRQLIEDLSNTTQVSFLTNNILPEDFWSGLTGVDKMYSSDPKVIIEINNLDIISDIVKRLRDKQIEFSSFTVKTATLEDVYLDLTGKAFEN